MTEGIEKRKKRRVPAKSRPRRRPARSGGRGTGEKIAMPAIPLRDIVVFPGMVVPLLVGRQKTINAVEEAQSYDNNIVLVFQKDPRVEDPDRDDLLEVGVLARLVQVSRQPEGQIKLLAEALERVTVEDVFGNLRFFALGIGVRETDSKGDREEEALLRLLMEALENYLQLNPVVPREALGNLYTLDNPEQLADMVAGYLPIKRDQREKILFEKDFIARLRFLLACIKEETEVMNVQRRIQGEVFKKLEKSQRDYILQEQMKTIQQELGKETESSEIKVFKEKIEKSGMPAAVRKKALEELDRFSRMMNLSPEAAVIRNYLDWMVSLPWSKTTRDHLEIDRAAEILDEDHYGLEKAKERILEYLAVRKRTRKLKGPIICLVGPPGSGKTSLGKSVARALGRQFTRMSLGGVRDEAEIRGHRRTYIGSLPGRIIQSLRKAGVRNPVFLLDEVDKIGVDFRGDPASALLEVLDPEQNFAFNDHYLEVDFDLSQVLFITTANSEATIPEPLLDRMEIIYLPGYTLLEKMEIASRYLVPREMEANGLKEGEIQFSGEALAEIIRSYTREAGVRTLQRQIAAICRKTVKSREMEKKKAASRETLRVTARSVSRFLGVPRYLDEKKEREPRAGVVTGLAWTEYGGDVLHTEVIDLPGRGEPVITGRLGETMRESCRIAISLVRLHAQELGVNADFYRTRTLHIHVPSGAIPKDGPSAGITLAVAIASRLSGKAVPRDLAMTGEITLRGKVMAIGGLRAKLLAASRAGMKTVLIPEDNRKDLSEIPRREKAGLRIVPVGEVGDVFRLALGEPALPGGDPDAPRKPGARGRKKKQEDKKGG